MVVLCLVEQELKYSEYLFHRDEKLPPVLCLFCFDNFEVLLYECTK